jgi:hypothetical protein
MLALVCTSLENNCFFIISAKGINKEGAFLWNYTSFFNGCQRLHHWTISLLEIIHKIRMVSHSCMSLKTFFLQLCDHIASIQRNNHLGNGYKLQRNNHIGNDFKLHDENLQKFSKILWIALKIIWRDPSRRFNIGHWHWLLVLWFWTYDLQEGNTCSLSLDPLKLHTWKSNVS